MGVDNCVVVYVMYSVGEMDVDFVFFFGVELIVLGGYWVSIFRDVVGGSGFFFNLVIIKVNVFEVFYVRLLEGDDSIVNGSNDVGNLEMMFRGGFMVGFFYVKFEFVCYYRFVICII